MSVRVSGFKEGMQPDLSLLPVSGIALLGQSDQSFQNIVIINGRRQVSGFSGRIFQYRMVPERTGSYNLGPIRVVGDGKVIASAPGPSVTVRPIPSQDHVLLFLEPSKQRVIPDEPFDVTMRILVRRLAPPYADISPLPEGAPPFLGIPYLERAADDGLERENIEQRLNAMQVGGGESFRINGIGAGGDPFGSMFGTRQQARFRLDRREVLHNGRAYYEYAFTLRHTPLREGIHRFGPVIFKGQVFVLVTPQGEGRTENIYALSGVADVEVAPPPTEGRPPTYIGAVGSNLTVSAALDAQTCYIGDPLTLTIEIGGDMRLDNITAPRLETQEALRRDFRIYDDTVQRDSAPGRRRYRFTVRPSRAGTLEFPPVAVSYYDTASAAYRTVYTEPIPVRANAVTEVRSDIIINADGQSVTIAADADDTRPPPAPFVFHANLAVADAFFIPALHLPLLLAGPLLCLALALLRRFPALLASLRRRRERRGAGDIALRRIRRAGAQAEGTADAGLEVARALRDYLRVHCGELARSAMPEECARLLRDAGIADKTAVRFARCLEACSHAAFGGGMASGGPAPEEEAVWRREAEELVAALETAWRRTPRRGRRAERGTGAAIFLLAALTASLSAAAALRPEAGFEEQRAATAMLRAAKPGEFAEAAEALAALADQGAANAALFYNYGTALLLAGDPAGALEALARAERHGGASWGIRRNMLLARRALNEDAPSAMPWYRIPFFWHFHFPAARRMTAAAIAFSIAWLAVPFLRRREAVSIVFWIAISVFLLSGASVLSSVYTERHDALARRLPHTAAPEDLQ